MKKYYAIFLFLIAAVVFSSPAHAVSVGDLDPNKDYLMSLNDVCGTQVISTGSNGQELKFISTIVHCFETVIEGVAMEAMDKVSKGLQMAVNTAMLLYVIIFGIRIVSGQVSSPRGELVIHAIKIGVVSWLINNAGIYDLWYMTLDIYKSMLEIMIAPAQLNSCPAQFMSLDYIWETMDCLFGKLTGFAAQNGYGSSWQGIMLIGTMLVSKASQSGGAYFVTAFIANALLTILFSFFQIALAYIISMMGLTLLFALAPLMLPMMFFPKTVSYFEAWWRMIFSFIFQVVILFAFISFAFAIMDQIYDGPDGLKQLYESTKISNEVARTDTLGTNSMYWQKSTVLYNDAMQGKGDMNMIVNFISLLVLGYLLLSFIGVIGQIAHEIAGSSAYPNLMGSAAGSMPIPKM